MTLVDGCIRIIRCSICNTASYHPQHQTVFRQVARKLKISTFKEEEYVVYKRISPHIGLLFRRVYSTLCPLKFTYSAGFLQKYCVSIDGQNAHIVVLQVIEFCDETQSTAV